MYIQYIVCLFVFFVPLMCLNQSCLCETEPPAQLVLRQHDDSCYDNDSSNPFNESAEPYTQTPGNPFDEPNLDTDFHPDPEPSKSRPKKGVRPVDMSKYLYADATHNEDEELDE